ncbi:flagellar motor protein MotB [Lacrimispora sp.]|uniref:flagellar motor protein MotB n=1 Tax=Lacrimispora sp. TaxID=2719234 RepID=UPI002899A75A|nr:flagellar motor protein MotB [Lacrimispora sp.]
MSKKREHVHQEEEAGEAWLLPYSDLMTLLLAVFIVLFAVSKIDAEKAQQISEQFAGTMMNKSYTTGAASGTGSGGDGAASGMGSGGDGAAQTGGPLNIETQSELESFMGEYELKKLENLKTELDTKLHNQGMDQSVSTMIDMRGLVIRLNNAIFFDSGSAEIKEQSEETLVEVASILNSIDNYIRVEGHTDNVPIRRSNYPSNWELSTARAVNVVKLFINKCNFSPDKLLAVGYGEFKPVADNSTEEGRAKNRRIDVIVLSAQYDNLEEQLLK